MKPEMTPVQSSQVRSVGYDAVAADLYVTFNSGATYAYHGVPSSVYAALLNTDSIGRFINTNIKPSYAYTRQDDA